MHSEFKRIAYTKSVRDAQRTFASNEANLEFRESPAACTLSIHERQFIAERDGFYMSSVNENGWPYVQYRGGPPGFLKVIGENTLAFADFRGNRQYISTGNLQSNPRVCLFFMDYAHRRRLKVFALARWVKIEDAGDLRDLVLLPDYRALVERMVVMEVQAFDWNCPQHITQRFTVDEWAAMGLENQ